MDADETWEDDSDRFEGSGGISGGGYSTGGGIGETGGWSSVGGGLVTGGAGGSSGGTGGATGGAGGSSGGTGGAAGGSGGVGGTGGGCSSNAECVSADSCLVGRCVRQSCQYSIRDQDADGYTDLTCGGSDCNDLNPEARPGLAEVCDDAADNDCNNVADCFDPACKGGACGCVPSPSGENCENGTDDDCDQTVDCNDADCFGTEACGCLAETCGNGADDDCDGQVDCFDSDCFADELCTCTARTETCNNRADEDCDGLIDCADPGCIYSPACLCLNPKPEKCSDGRDNDCDGLVDCGDPSCFASAACASCTPEQCSGEVDEDCDGLVDCADPSCAFAVECPARAEECNNERDDDFDGDTDCDDFDCSNVPVCLELQNTCATARLLEPLASATYTGTTQSQVSHFSGTCGGAAGEAVFELRLTVATAVRLDTVGTSFDSVMYVRRGNCGIGQELACDDDSGGYNWSSAIDFPVLSPGTYFIFVDGLTVGNSGPDDGPYVLNVEVGPAPENCSDSTDNDGDLLADCADPDCALFGTCSTCNQGGPAVVEFGPPKCTDGRDNDCDGLSDCADEDCSASLENITECCTGTDQNGNGIPDDFNCRCRNNADCAGGQICYTSTLEACGLPCYQYYGDICPFTAPGSSCNLTTGQCEF